MRSRNPIVFKAMNAITGTYQRATAIDFISRAQDLCSKAKRVIATDESENINSWSYKLTKIFKDLEHLRRSIIHDKLDKHRG